MKILRVFPHKNSYIPDDNMVLIGYPPADMFIPEHDEIHISCVFSWDKQLCKDLQFQWQGKTDKPVLLGGPAFGSKVEGFQQGIYLKKNIIFTSRGCNNNCSFCIVPKLEGRLKEIEICEGNIIQDNNFLQTSEQHKQKVYEMLKHQKGICFKGGLETDLITEKFAQNISELSIKELWLACDSDSDIPSFKKAMEILKRYGFAQRKIYCYALIGGNMNKNEARLQEIYNEGAMPRAQLYQPLGQEKKKEYSKEWQHFQCQWYRTPATKAHMEKGTDYNNFRNVELDNQIKF